MGTISLGGTKIFSYQIENILNQFLPRTTLNYKVIVKKKGNIDLISILIEASENFIKDKNLSKQILNAF